MIKKSWLAGLAVLVSLCLAGCTLNGAVRKAQPYIKEANTHIKEAQKIWKKIESYDEKRKTQYEEAKNLFARLDRKEKPDEVDLVVKQFKSKLEELKKTASGVRGKVTESKKELRLAKEKFSQAKEVGLSGWKLEYVKLLINSYDFMMKAVAKHEEKFDVELEHYDTWLLYANRIATAKKKIYNDELTTAEYKAYEKKYLTPTVDKLNEQSSQLEELQEEAEELVGKADSLSQKADQLYKEKTK